MKFIPYNYEPDKSIKVYRETELYLESKPEVKIRIEELGWVYHTIGMIVPQNSENLWSGHFFPFIDSWEELQVSFNLICFGLYKQAFVSLRSSLELGLLSVYYNINDNGHVTIRDWLHSVDIKEANTPKADKIWKILLSNDNIKKFNDKHNLRNTFDNLGYLHNYVHTKGMRYSNTMGLMKTVNSQAFDPRLIDKWLNSYAEIVSLVCSLHLLKYPIAVLRFDYRKKFGIDLPSFGGLDGFNIDKLARILPDNYLNDIEKIANDDPTTQATIKEISEFPDMTESQLEDQIIDHEKFWIEQEGFLRWISRQKELLKLFNQIEFDDKMERRIEVLRIWAIEKGFLDPMPERLGWNINLQEIIDKNNE